MVYNSQLIWVGNNTKLMHSLKKEVFVFEKQVCILQSRVFTLQSKNKLICTSRNTFLNIKIMLKEYNIILADIIVNLNNYIIQFQISFTNNNANILPFPTFFHCKQKIFNPLLFIDNKSKT